MPDYDSPALGTESEEVRGGTSDLRRSQTWSELNRSSTLPSQPARLSVLREDPDFSNFPQRTSNIEDAAVRRGTSDLRCSESRRELDRTSILPSQSGYLSVVREDPVLSDFPQRTSNTEDAVVNDVEPGSSISRLQSPPFHHPSPTPTTMAPSGVLQKPLDDDYHTNRFPAPPSYRTMGSMLGSLRRPRR
jgi:hypothetical protein